MGGHSHPRPRSADRHRRFAGHGTTATATATCTVAGRVRSNGHPVSGNPRSETDTQESPPPPRSRRSLNQRPPRQACRIAIAVMPPVIASEGAAQTPTSRQAPCIRLSPFTLLNRKRSRALFPKTDHRMSSASPPRASAGPHSYCPATTYRHNVTFIVPSGNSSHPLDPDPATRYVARPPLPTPTGAQP